MKGPYTGPVDPKLSWPACERNKDPLLAVLRDVLPARGLVLEIASGTGQHVAHFAARLPDLTFQPTDPAPDHRASIAAWTEGLPNVRPPLPLDVTERPWGIGPVDALVCANMVHIAPWEACEGLLAGAGEEVRPGGPVVIYGPFRRAGHPFAESNAAFDADLRRRDARWGVRDLERVLEVAARAGLALEEVREMPANNLAVVLRRS